MTKKLANDELFYCIDFDKFNIPYIMERFYTGDKDCTKYIKHNPIFETKAKAREYLMDIWALIKKYKGR